MCLTTIPNQHVCMIVTVHPELNVHHEFALPRTQEDSAPPDERREAKKAELNVG